MKSTTLLLIGGLAFAGTALAGDPSPQETSTSSSMKVGIDAKTGKLRPLTQAESAQLDAAAAKNQKSALASKNVKTRTLAKGETLTPQGFITFVASNGMTITELGDSQMVDLQATIGADGKVIVSHDGEAVQNAGGAANE